jgi:acetyl-CoA synthetase
MTTILAREIVDQVPIDNRGSREIGFDIPARYNASRILFDNLALGRGERLALTGPAGARSYIELCAEASRWVTAPLAGPTARRAYPDVP